MRRALVNLRFPSVEAPGGVRKGSERLEDTLSLKRESQLIVESPPLADLQLD
jgi:hypothetical protein